MNRTIYVLKLLRAGRKLEREEKVVGAGERGEIEQGVEVLSGGDKRSRGERTKKPEAAEQVEVCRRKI